MGEDAHADLKRIAEQMVAELGARGYAYWMAQRFSVTMERQQDGQSVGVEANVIQRNSGWVQVAVEVYDGRRSVSASLFVPQEHEQPVEVLWSEVRGV